MLVNALMNGSKTLPASVEDAFTNWPGISSQLHRLFARAPREAISDPQALLARMALDAIEENGFPREAADEVRAKANAIIAECAARDEEKIVHVLAEPQRLLEQLDGLVVSMRAPKEPMGKWDAMGQVGGLLDVCQRLDKALSAIPSKLRSDEDG